MHARSFADMLTQACIALALVLCMVNTAASGRPVGPQPPAPSSHGSDQTMTLYTAGAAVPPNPGDLFSELPFFTSQGPIGRSGRWLRTLTRPGALRPGTVTVVDEQFHGERELGLPLAGKLQGVIVASLASNGSCTVAVKALFASGGAGDSLRFFGVHHNDEEESQIAVVGGTGRYDGAAGFAVVRAAGVTEKGGNGSLSRPLSFRVHLK